MSFKIDFLNKVVDQFRGWFQNQKPTSPSSSNVASNSIRLPSNVPSTTTTTTTTTSTTTTESPTISVGNSKFHLNLNSPRSSRHVGSNSNNHNNNNNNDSKYVNYYEQAAMNRQQQPQHQPVLPPSSLSLSTWSASPGTPNSGGSNIPASPYNNSFGVTSQHHHQYHQQQQPQPLSSCNYSQTNSYNHQNHNNNFNQSSSSSSASFGPPTPSSITTTTSVTTNHHNNRHHSNDNPITAAGGLGPRSYSAINTPESPNNFRRQHSLNVNQRVPGSSRLLQLDLRNQKKSPLYAKQSASTDLIDKHSLSPRPRPKDLSLSSSQDNMSKGYHNNNQMDGSSQPPLCNQNRPDKLFKMNPPPNHQVEGGIGGTANARVNKYQFKLTPKLSYSMIINGKEYANLRESDFKKLEQLGAGNFGQVDKMLHIRSNTELAIKKMRRSGNIDDNRHVQRDLELLQKCNYIHVVKCYGFLLLETEVWIFMELMSTCFDHLIKKLAQNDETVPEPVIGKVAVATIDALHYLKEEHNGIHRDIKPSNILINNQGIIKLCDFGISGSLINSRANSRSVGSTPYIAPERIEPPPDGYYDIRSDIWSMGITLVEIATGKFPYTDWSTDFEILTKVMLEQPPKLPSDKDFSDEFRQFINDCLIKDYSKRPKYRELMNKPFYKNYKDADVDVAQWFQQAYNGDNGDGSKNNNPFAMQSTNNGS